MTIAFNNNPAQQREIIAQVKAHEAADEIIQGEYWEGGKGCFIGCIAHSSEAATVEDLTGMPVMLVKIAENIFEGLPNDEAKTFPLEVVCAPRLGADLSLVAWQFLERTVKRALELVGDEAQRKCADAVDVIARKARGDDVSKDTAYAAAYAAADAAAADAAAAYAAYAAAYAVAYAAYAAANAAADAVAYAAAAHAAAAHAAERRDQRQDFIELLKAA